jgi:hypothetical protein
MPKKRFSAEQIVTLLRRPHSALNYRPPAPQTFAPLAAHLVDQI